MRLKEKAEVVGLKVKVVTVHTDEGVGRVVGYKVTVVGRMHLVTGPDSDMFVTCSTSPIMVKTKRAARMLAESLVVAYGCELEDDT